jgi:hypothetical protein
VWATDETKKREMKAIKQLERQNEQLYLERGRRIRAAEWSASDSKVVGRELAGSRPMRLAGALSLTGTASALGCGLCGQRRPGRAIGGEHARNWLSGVSSELRKSNGRREHGQGVSRITVATIDLQRLRKRPTYLLRPAADIGVLLATAPNAEQSGVGPPTWPTNAPTRSIAASMTAAAARGINERGVV